MMAYPSEADTLAWAHASRQRTLEHLEQSAIFEAILVLNAWCVLQ